MFKKVFQESMKKVKDNLYFIVGFGEFILNETSDQWMFVEDPKHELASMECVHHLDFNYINYLIGLNNRYDSVNKNIEVFNKLLEIAENGKCFTTGNTITKDECIKLGKKSLES